MSFVDKLLRLYFDLVYNATYDLTTAQSTTYRGFQKRCIDKFGFEEGDSILCVGIGTGNEIIYILDGNKEIEISGVDTSERALRRAYRKGLQHGRDIQVLRMDAQNLKYPAETFNKVLCCHVMDFINDDGRATREIIRVLKRNGQFVITYPSGKEGIKLGLTLLKDSIPNKNGLGKFVRILSQLLVRMGAAILYLPLLLRTKKRFYSRQDLEAMFIELKPVDVQIEEYAVYNDFIVYGRK